MGAIKKPNKYINIYITNERAKRLNEGKVVFCNNKYRLVPAEYRKTREIKELEDKLKKLKKEQKGLRKKIQLKGGAI